MIEPSTVQITCHRTIDVYYVTGPELQALSRDSSTLTGVLLGITFSGALAGMIALLAASLSEPMQMALAAFVMVAIGVACVFGACLRGDARERRNLIGEITSEHASAGQAPPA